MPDARLAFAETIAREAGQLALSMRRDPAGLRIDTKGPQDFVTAADLAVETLIRTAIAAAYPEDAVLGEEGGLTGVARGCWILDPIDGTANYMRGMPEWAISVGYFDGTDLTHGVIFAPDTNELASARAGAPATLNGAPIHVSPRTRMDESMVILGYSRRIGTRRHLALIDRILTSGSEYRRLGAATIGFLSVATGRVEAYFEPNLNVWDAAAGVVIVRAAGGIASTPAFPNFLQEPGEVFVTNQNVAALGGVCRA